MNSRRAFLGSLAAGLAAGRRTPAWPAPSQTRNPNIIFILADDLGYGDPGCYGQKLIKTPNIDRLATQGTRFTQCYAGSTVCAPSRCALMTGLHTGHARIRGNANVPLEPGDLTVAEVLQRAGYTTGIVGKWGLGEPGSTGVPNKKGFDYWFGYLNQTHAHNYYPDYLWRNGEKYPLRKGEYSHDLFTREALDFVKRSSDRPFFLYLAYTIPHANNELFRATGNGQEVPTDAPYSKESWSQPNKNFAAMVTRMDTDIRRLMALLKELRLEEKTIVFFTSDNGPQKEGGNDPAFFDSSGPLRGIKRDLYEGGIRVPMIVRWPGRVREGATSKQVWAFWDFLPTVAEMVGADSLGAIDGISMLPALLGNSRRDRDHEYLYWEFHEGGFKQAVRMKDWKAVRLAAGRPLELYDLIADVSERNDIAGRHPGTVAKMEKILATCRTQSKDWPIG
jgi:arylsulfatase A-like enzyme